MTTVPPFTSGDGEMLWGGGECAAISAAAEFDALVAKFSAEGQCEWATRFGGESNYDRGRGVAFDSTGDVLVTGYFARRQRRLDLSTARGSTLAYTKVRS